MNDRIDRSMYSNSHYANIIVSSYTNWDALYSNREGAYGYTVRIEFITNEESGIKCMNTYKWHNNRYLGCERKYIKNKQ